MRKTIKVRAGNLEQARKEFEKEIHENVFVLKIIDEFDADQPTYDNGYSIGNTVEEAIESATSKLLDPYFIKSEVVPELAANTNMIVPVLVKAEIEAIAKSRAEGYIKDQFFPNVGYITATDYYIITDNQIVRRGFKGVFGIGKQDNTYKFTFLLKPQIRLKYSMWSYIIAEITDDKKILNDTMLKCARKHQYDEVKYLIEQGADVNYCDKSGRNALFYIYSESSLDVGYEISMYLIEKGIDYKKCDNSGNNVLTYDLRRQDYLDENRFDGKLREFLVKNGVHEKQSILNKTMIKYIKERLFFIVKKLIEHGADVNYCDEDGRNALFYTYSDCEEEYETNKWLIDRGIDYKKCDNFGDNVLTYVLKIQGYLNPYRFKNKLRDFLENNGVKEDEVLLMRMDEKERLDKLKWRKEEREKKKPRYCPNCKKTVNVLYSSYDYDDGWFTRVIIKCKVCDTELFTEAIQN